MAENVQELIIRYRADVEDLQGKVAQIEAELRKVPSAANQAGQATTQAFQKTGTEAKKATTNVGDFSAKVKASVTNIKPISDQFASLGSAIVGAFAVERIIQFGFESVKAFEEAEKNAVKLKSAVSVNGGLQSDFDELIKQSKELQEITIFSDDAVQNAQTAALQFGLTREQVQKLIPAVADFASATGQDLQSALEGVLQGVNGSERALKKYGITVDQNGTRTSRLAEIADQLNKKFEGQAEVIGTTAFGAAQKYKNQVDELQESLGQRLSPLLNDIKSQFLVVADGAITAGEGVKSFFESVNDFFGGGVDRIPQLIGAAGKANLQAIQEAKKAFEALSDGNISAKIEVFTSALEQAKEEAKGLGAEQAQQANKRISEYANQITALRLIQAERKKGISGLDEETAALDRLKNISSLSDIELQQLSKTLAKFNDIKATDAIDQIQKELEARQKGTAKSIEDKKKGLDELAKLEQNASDKILQIKASEVDKVAELEQKKQEELRNLVSAAGTASGANIAPIELEFKQTGRVDIERTIQLLKDAKFPEAEIQKFIQAITNTSKAFDILINKEQEASKEVQLKINAENIQSDFQDLKSEFDRFQQREEIAIQVKFIQAGDFSPEAIEKFNAEILASRQKTDAELIEQAKKFGLTQAEIDDLVLKNKLANNEAEIAANKEKLAKILSQDQESTQKRKELINEIRDTAIEFATTLITDTIDKRAEADIAAVERTKDAEVKAIDERIAANDERQQKGIIGERDAEKNHEKLLQEKKKAEDRADNAERQIKRKQFRNDQLSSVAKVVIANTVNAAEFPALAALYAALAVAQSAIILSQPNPYKKGSKKTKPGLSIVGEEGPEFVMMPAASKVVTAQKTKQHERIIDAIMDNRLDEHIEKTFVAPAIKQEREKQVKKDSKIISESLNQKSLSKESKTDSKTTSLINESITNMDSSSFKKSSEVNTKQVNEVLNSRQENKTSRNETQNNKQENSDIKQYSSIIEAMYLGKVDEYLKQTEVSKEVKRDVLSDSVINHRELNNILSNLQVSPILKQAERNHEAKKQEDFAANISNSIILHGKALTREDYYQVSSKNRKKGMPITNAHEIVEPIIEALKENQPPSYKR